MGILLKNHEFYALQGYLTPVEWRAKLNSNEGLFQKITAAMPLIVGPHLNPSGRVIGDMMSIETKFFYDRSSSDQQQFYEQLLECNTSAAMEYLLRMTEAAPIWRQDLQWLQQACNYLTLEEHFLREEEHYARRGVVIPFKNVPQSLKKHFPGIFHDFDFRGFSPDEVARKAEEQLLREVEPEEQYLHWYLESKRRELPFLFSSNSSEKIAPTHHDFQNAA